MGDQAGLQIRRGEVGALDRAHQHEPIARAGCRHVEALLVAQHGERCAPRPIRHHGQEHDVALVALESGAVRAEDGVPLHRFLADTLRQHHTDEFGLFGADERDDADAPRLGPGLGHEAGDLFDDHMRLGGIDLPGAVASAVRHEDIDERGVDSLGRGRDAQRHELFGIELHGEADDRLDAAEVFSEHQAAVGEYGPHQVVEALARLEQAPVRQVAQVMLA